MVDLPIDVVPGTDPPVFRWRQTVDHLAGRSVQEHEGMLPPSLEGAVAVLVALAKRQAQEIDSLHRMNVGLADRVAAQAELLSKRAEAPATTVAPKKGRG